MKISTVIWTILFVLGAAFLVFRSMTGNGFAKAYVQKDVVEYSEISTPADADDDNQNPILKWVPTSKLGEHLSDTIILTDSEPIIRTVIVGTSAKAFAYKNGDYIPSDDPAVMQEYADVQGMSRDELDDEFAKLKEQSDACASVPGSTEQHDILLSIPRTFGLWMSAIFTLCIFSFLYKDNPLYKFAESVVVGVSAAYWMAYGIWTTLVPNLFGKLTPGVMRDFGFLPGTSRDADIVNMEEWTYIVPLILGIMLLWRLAPKGGWISRWPLAFIIGSTAGIKLYGFMGADFLSQIKNGIDPLIVTTAEPTIDNIGDAIIQSIKSILLFIGLMSGLVFFFFSMEHKGVVGKVAKIGIWFLMITFGAGFGYTVMGRIALLAIRLEFLFNDWLWLIDPGGVRPPGW